MSGREFNHGDHRRSHVPEEPVNLCPALRPRSDRCIRPYDASGMVHADTTSRTPTMYFRGSITRLQFSLSTLRRMSYPISTQDSLPVAGQLYREGITPPGFQRKVSKLLPTSLPPFSSFVAQGVLDLWFRWLWPAVTADQGETHHAFRSDHPPSSTSSRRPAQPQTPSLCGEK